MNNIKEDLSQYSGEEYYRRPLKLNLPEIRLNGNEGSFKRVVKVNNEYVVEDIGNELIGTILRIRRKLVDYKEKISTSEHNHPNDIVTLFGANDKGVAKELRQKYQNLRTQQILYFLLDTEELVKVVVRGASLGSENKPEDSISFYDYLNSFEKDEHIWEYQTKLIPMPEKGKLGTYYAISFEKANKIEDLTSVNDKKKEISFVLKSQDEYYKLREEKDPEVIGKKEEKENVPTVQIDDEDTKAEDLPF